jgi:large subunit ribosomal protein L29
VKTKEIREHSNDQLKTELEAIQRRLFELKSQSVTEKMHATTELGKARHDVARIKTVLRERELVEQKKTAAAGAEVKTA